MSDEEYERFEISDYDLQNEFNINRRGRRATKKQQIYGVFAEDNSDDDDNGGGRGRGQRGKRGGAATKDYTAHVPFVAGGIQQSGKKKDEARVEKSKSDEDKDNDDDADADESPTTRRAAQINDTSSESEDDAKAAASRSGFGMANMAGFRQRGNTSSARSSSVAGTKWDQHTKGIGAKLLLKMGYKPGGGLGKDLQGIAQPVQAHVRKGRGAIGAYGSEKGQTIGDVSAKATSAKPKVDEDQREREEFQQKIHQWRKPGKNDATTARNKTDSGPRYSYKTVQDVIDRGNKQNKKYILSDQISSKITNTTVIDMTGPEKRVLSGYHALGQTRSTGDDILYEHRAAKRCDNFSLPELQHNLQLIVDMCEQDIIAIDKSQRSCVDQQQQLRDEQEELRKIVTLERSHIEQLDGAMRLVDRLLEDVPTEEVDMSIEDNNSDVDGEPEANGKSGSSSSGSGATRSLDRAAQIFGQLQRDFAAEYTEFGLADLAPGIVAPLIAMCLHGWQPLVEPRKPVQTVRRWRAILGANHGALPATNGSAYQTSEAAAPKHHFDPYSALIWASVIPHLRRACSEEWDPREHAPMANLLDAWSSVLPAWQLDNVLEHMVLPRIAKAVDAWDPLTDTVPVHQWILPWQQLLGGGAKLEERVYQTIRVKLGAALVAWQPVDRSARAMLEPWIGVMAAAPMEVFLVRHILPKLQQSLEALVINPMQQNLELWLQVAEWHTIIPTPLMVSMLDRHFFPKWLQTLVIWLNQAPNLDQVSRWYSGWKSQIPPDCLAQPAIKDHFNRALSLMQRTLGGMEQPTQSQTVPPSQAPPHLQMPTYQQSQQMMPPVELQQHKLQVPPPPPQLDFRELVSQKCAERGIMFLPMPGRREHGKQVYRVGKLFCYIERAVIMLSDGTLSNWAPVSLQTMLDRSFAGNI